MPPGQMTSPGMGGRSVLFISEVGIICHLPRGVVELVVIFTNHSEVALAQCDMLGHWLLSVLFFLFRFCPVPTTQNQNLTDEFQNGAG